MATNWLGICQLLPVVMLVKSNVCAVTLHIHGITAIMSSTINLALARRKEKELHQDGSAIELLLIFAFQDYVLLLFQLKKWMVAV